MRVTYGREMSVKKHLDEDGVENFIPMKYEIVERKGERVRELVPAVANLVFIRSTEETINAMKHFNSTYTPLRYIMHDSTYDSLHEIMTISDAAMDNFMKVAQTPSDQVFYLEPGEYINNHIGKRVTITAGPFAGVQGIIKRIKRNKHVVVQLDGIIAAAIDFVTNEILSFLEKK